MQYLKLSFTNSISYPTLQPINHEEHQPRRTKPKPRNVEPNHETQKSRRTPKPRNPKITKNKTQTCRNLETQTETHEQQNPNHEPKKKKNQRGGDSEGDGDD